MKTWLRWLGVVALACLCGTASAGETAIRLGVLNDPTGPAADLGGTGSILAVRMAVEDFGRTVLGKPIEVVSADHGNKADIGAGIARRWYDQDGVDIILDLPNSSVALAVFQVAGQKGRLVVSASGLSSVLSAENCIPTGFVWNTDTYSLARATASSIVKNGGDRWFFLTADFAFGKAFDADASEAIRQAGGQVIGRVLHPYAIPDFSSQLLIAQASGAKIIGLANGGIDVVNVMKQSAEFDIRKSQRIAAFLMYLTDVRAIGLRIAQGTLLANTFYWDADDRTRAWSRRFMAKHGTAPTMVHAATYSAALHFLNAVKESATDDPLKVAAKMREMPVEDFYTHGVRVRPDGRLPRDHFLFEVKKPEMSRYSFDYFRLVSTIPGDTLVRPIAESACPLVRK